MRHKIIILFLSAFILSCGNIMSEGIFNQEEADKADVTAPMFLGCSAVYAVSNNSVRLLWTAANDNRTKSEKIIYDIYYKKSTDPASEMDTPKLTTPAGTVDFTVILLTPDTSYSFRVKARDQAGNSDINTVTKSAYTHVNTVGNSIFGLDRFNQSLF